MRELGDLGTGAVIYAGGWGWPVFRLRPNSKMPGTAHGFHDATTDSAQVVEEWTRHPNANVGVATGAVSGLVVVDVDPHGDETVRALTDRLGPLPTSMVVRTPRGWHVYLRHPGERVPCSTSRLGQGVDVRADGGYVVAPPSVVSGATYRWNLPADRVEPLPEDLPEIPAAWVEALRAPKPAPDPRDRDANYVRAAIRSEVERVRSAAEGTRNTTLNAAAFAVARFAVDGRVRESDLVTLLVTAGADVGLPVEEARRTVRSAFEGRRAVA